MLVGTGVATLALAAATPRAFARMGDSAAAGQPLLIVGAGVLGRLAAANWRDVQGDGAGEVVGVTRRADAERDAAFVAEGIVPRVRSELDRAAEEGAEGCRWPYVLFCASPGGNDDYAAEVAGALKLWDSEAPGGRFVFTSSAGVYAEDAGGVVTEGSAVGSSPRAARLLDAEARVLGAGGTVLRLAGLYLIDRGAHNAWLSMEAVAQRADGLINQVHYADAAAAAVACLLRGSAGETLLAADDAPMTRDAICRAAVRAPRFAGRAVPPFTKTEGGVGKVVDCTHTRERVGWQPRYKTFDAFIDSLVEAEAD